MKDELLVDIGEQGSAEQVRDYLDKQQLRAKEAGAPVSMDSKKKDRQLETKSERIREIVESFGWRLVGELALMLYKHALLEDKDSLAIHEELDANTGEIIVHGDPAYLPSWLQRELNEKVEVKETEDREPRKLKRKHELLLEELVDIGLLSRREVARTVTCPKCTSPRLQLRLYCPNCGSDSVKPTRLIQHIVCGFTDAEDRFEKVEEGLRCPLCKTSIVDFETQIRVLGKTFYCESCGLTFKQPNTKIRCLNRETLEHEPNYEFDLLSISVRKLWGYRLAPGKEENPLEIEMILEESIRMFSVENNIPLEVYPGRGTLRVEKIPKELKNVGFTVIIETLDGRLILVDLARGRDPLPYIMKATLLEGKEDVSYIMLATPDVEVEENLARMGIEEPVLERSNIEVIKILEGGSFGRLIRRIQEIVSKRQS